MAFLCSRLAAVALSILLSAPAIRAQEGIESAEILFTRAIVAYDGEKYAEALRDLLKAHELDPRHVDVIYYLGLTYRAQKNYAQAALYLRKGLELEPKNLDLRSQLGLALLDQERFDDALKEFLSVYAVEPQRENLGYYVGLTYYQKKDYENATAYFRKNVSTDVSIRQLSQVYLGHALQALGREAEAIEELTEAVKIEPKAPIVGATQQLLTALRERTGEKPLRIELTLNAQYDSNIAGLHRPEASFGNLVNARVDYTLYRKGPWESTATYSFLHILNYQNRAQDSAHDYDVQDHLIAANLYYRTTVPGGLPATLGIQLNNDLLRLGGKKFLQRPTGTLTLTVQENPSNFTTLLYRAQYKDFFEHPISIEDRRDTLNQLGGLLHYIRFAGGQYQINIGYNYDDEDFGGTNWRYTGHRAIAGFVIGLPWELEWATNVEYHTRVYNGTNSIFGKARRDTQLTALTSLSKPILKNWCPPNNPRCLTLTLQHLWDNNQSSITYYETHRQVVALGLTWRY